MIKSIVWPIALFVLLLAGGYGVLNSEQGQSLKGTSFQPSDISKSIREDLVAGASRTQTTLNTDALVTVESHRIVMTDFNAGYGYAVIDNGKSNKEIIRFTGITDNTTYYTLTGVEWGCNSYNTTCSVAANKKRHNSGASFSITTDFHFVSDNFVDIEGEQTLTGEKTFATSTDGAVTRIKVGDSSQYMWSNTSTDLMGWSVAGSEYQFNDSGTTFVAVGALALTSGELRVATSTNWDWSSQTFDDLYVTDNLTGDGDTDTYIDFAFDDILDFNAGGFEFFAIKEKTQSEFVVNDRNEDIDFSIETVNATDMFWIDGALSKVGIATSTFDTYSGSYFIIATSTTIEGNATTTGSFNVEGECTGCSLIATSTATIALDTDVGDDTTLTVSCPTGYSITGGGYSGVVMTGGNGSAQHEVMLNYPLSSTSWRTVIHCNSDCQAGTLEVTAICIKD